tara:strand:- start:2 stop:787 length:786 start_codon:yes stop_codon:yes gene_type:complete
MDINAIKKKLNQLQTSTSIKDNLWKPKPGTNQVRIVPYTHNKDNPFIELFFHYDIGNRTYMSPISFGRPDPIEEFAEKLKSSGNRDDWKLGRKLDAKMRTFLPVIERGKEREGVKFWGFGKTVYQELLGFIADPDYGDIADPITGRDVVVDFKTAEETGRSYPTTTIRVKPNQTPLTEDKDMLESLLENQTEITELYTEKSYDELAEILENWLNPTESSDDTTTSESSDAKTTTTANQSSPKTEKVAENVGDAFEDLFGDK